MIAFPVTFWASLGPPAAVWTMQAGSINSYTPPTTFSWGSDLGATGSAGDFTSLFNYYLAIAYLDTGMTANTVSVAFTFNGAEVGSALGGPGCGVRWDTSTDDGVFANISYDTGSYIILLQSTLDGEDATSRSLTLTDGHSYTLTVTDDGSTVTATITDDVGTATVSMTPSLTPTSDDVVAGWASATATYGFANNVITSVSP